MSEEVSNLTNDISEGDAVLFQKNYNIILVSSKTSLTEELY